MAELKLNEKKYNVLNMENSKSIFKTFFKIPIKSNQKFPPLVVKQQFREKYLNVKYEAGFNNVGTQEKWLKFNTEYSKNADGSSYVSGYNTFTEEKYDLKKINYGIVTGSKNNVLVLDLDTSKDKWKSMKNEHPFIKHYSELFNVKPCDNFYDTIETIIYKLNTFTVKTPSGGFHIYWRINKNSNRPTKQSNLELDIKAEGGYVVGFNSKTDKGPYQVFNDVSVKDISNNDDKFLDIVYIYDKSPEKQKEFLSRKNKVRSLQNRPVDMTLWKYNMNEELFRNIKKGIDKFQKKYFDNKYEDYDFNNYFKMTTFLKMFDKKDLWIEYCKNNNGYDSIKNNELWNNINIEEAKAKYQPNCIVSCILYSIGKSQLLPSIKYRDLTKNVINPDLIVNSENTKGLAEVLDLDNNKNYVIQSGTNSGKTYLVNNYHHNLEYKTPILSIVSRTSLAAEHKRVFEGMNNDEDFTEYHNYADYKNENLYKFEGQNLIIQIDSLKKITNFDFSEYIVFIDELQSVFEYLDLSSTLDTKRKDIESIFIKIIRECKQFIGVDADIQDSVLEFLKHKSEVSVNIEFNFIKNEYCPYKNVEAEEIYSYDKMLDKIVLENDKFMLCCDSSTESHNIKNALLKKYPEKKEQWEQIKIIDRLYQGDMDLDNIDKLIFSPKVLYGLDSKMFRKVFCLFKGHTIPAKSMLQQVSRCRDIDKIYFHFMNKENIVNDFEFNNPNEVIDRIKYLDNYAYKKYDKIRLDNNKNEFDHTDKSILLDKYYNERMSKHLFNYDSDRTNKYFHFINGLKRMKINVISDGVSKNIKQKKSEINEIMDMTKQDLEKHFEENANNEYYERINDILHIPEEQFQDGDYKELFINPQAVHNHFNFCNLILMDEKYSEKKFIKQLEVNYSVNVSWGDENKLLWLKKLMNDLGMFSGSLNITKKLDNCKQYQAEYIKLFRDRSKTIDFEDDKQITKIVKKCIETLTGEKLYTGKQKESNIGGKRIKWTEYVVNESIKDKHLKILWNRNPPKIDYNTLLIED